MRRLLPFFMICFGIMAFSKLMSILNSDTTILGAIPTHAENKQKDSNDQPKEGQDRPPNEIKIVSNDGAVAGVVYNIDTSQIQKIATCERLYDLSFSPTEVELLQKLRTRREEIENYEKDIKLKTAMLESIRKDLEEKLVRLEKLNAEINDSEGETGGNYGKLVKIYEGMKPKEAAKIFDELQLSVMIGVARQMKENKLAAIVSEMQPTKARDLTMALARP